MLVAIDPETAAGDQEDEWSIILQLAPWRADLWEQYGASRLQFGQLQSAIQAFYRSEELGDLSRVGLLNLGDAYTRAGDLEAASKVYTQLIEDQDPVMDAYPRLIQVYRSTGNIPAAVTIVKQWKQVAYNPAEADFQEGLLLAVDDPAKAIESLWAAMADPGLAGRANALRIRLQAAEPHAEIYRLVVTGRALGGLGEWDLASLAFHRAVMLDGEYAEAWALLGEARQQLGDNGWPELEKARTLDKDSVVVRALLALYWRRQGNTALAMEALSSVAEDEPQQAFWQLELGNTAAQMNKPVAAIGFYKKAVQIEPTSPVYWRALAVFSTSMGLQIRETGLPAARQLVILAPRSADSYDVLGWSLYWLEDWYGAERALLHALEIDPCHPQANLLLGQVYLQMKESGQAYRHLSQAESCSNKGDEVNGAAKRLLAEILY